LRTQRRLDRIAKAVLLAGAIGLFLVPLVWTLLASLGLQPDNSAQPPTFVGTLTLDHFLEVGVAEPAFWQEVGTSTASAACAALLTITVAFPASYGLARSRFAGERLLAQGFLMFASLPAMAYVIPLSDLMRRVHLADSFVGLVLTEAAVTAPLAVYALHGSLAQLSPEWEEAARLEGAGLAGVLRRVVIPLSAGMLGATAIILLVLDWNLLLAPLVLTNGGLKTIPVALTDFFTFERELEWPTAAAALAISLIPVAVLVAAFSRVLNRFELASSID
jgi:ABC-type glycerol-3-phosphate transport system permease component